MKHHKLKYPVELMCKALGVSSSGYYNWLKSGPSKRWLFNQEVMEVIKDIFEDSFESYGAPRMKVELEKRGYKVSRPRTARMMRSNGLAARRKRKWKNTTDSNHSYPIHPNRLKQNFKVKHAGQVWVSDITYVETEDGWVYLTVIIDLFDRKVVGWSLSEDMTAENTVIAAWYAAIATRPITRKLIFHSDRGSQYACTKFCNILKSYGKKVKQSMSRKGNCWDNAVAESFFKSLKTECVYGSRFENKRAAAVEIFEYIEIFYNQRRRHSTLGQISPAAFERRSVA